MDINFVNKKDVEDHIELKELKYREKDLALKECELALRECEAKIRMKNFAYQPG
uniref:Uncharacterized protein n=1 Tax=Rhizophagus irregularis (strain DAOM 181602 / DAOM 197198 / MUCL 43194) TaxID=747089 RepID=U9U4E0_RHIID